MGRVQSYSMLLLALDTTTAAGSVALWRDGLIEERAGDPARSHAERLPGDLIGDSRRARAGAARRRALCRRRRAGLVHRPARSASPPSRAWRWSATGSCTPSGRSTSWRTTPPAPATPAPARPSSRGWRRTAARCSRRATASSQAAPHVTARRRAAIACAARRSSTCSIRRRCRRRSRWREAWAASGAGRVIVTGDGVPRTQRDPRRVLRRRTRRCASRRRWPARWRRSPRRTATRATAPARRRADLRAASRRRAGPRSRRRASDGVRPDVRRCPSAAARSRPRRAGPRSRRHPRRRRADLRPAVDARDVRVGVDPLRRGALLRRPQRGGAVVAYCAGWIIFDELHVNNLAVDPAWRRHGVASALLTFVLRGGRRRRAPRARRSRSGDRTSAARQLYERFGFAFAGVRTAYYREPVEDALVLWRNGPARVVDRKSGHRTGRLNSRVVLNAGVGWYSRHTQVARRNPVSFPWTNGPDGASDRGGRAWPSR